MLRLASVAILALMLALVAPPAQGAQSLASALATLKKVGRDGAGNREATAAWPVVAKADAAQLPILLAALDDAGPLGANYVRAAIDAVAERTLAAGQKLPHDQLEKYVLDTTHAPRSRRLAFEWLAKIDDSAHDRLIPRFLDDPSLELRRDAVARLKDAATAVIEEAGDDAAKKAPGIEKLQQAFHASRDLDQITALDKQLADLKREVDLARHFGFITSWRLIGPFDNRGGIGYDAVYPPEEAVQFTSRLAGKIAQLDWTSHTTKDRHGKVDLNTALGKDMGCVAYAAAEFYSPRDQKVDMRFGTANASKLWVNGELIAKHPIYHTGTHIDQYQSRANLRAGRNLILLKICQNEQKQSWAQVWDFQFRVCDVIGTAVQSDKTDKNQPRDARDEQKQVRN